MPSPFYCSALDVRGFEYRDGLSATPLKYRTVPFPSSNPNSLEYLKAYALRNSAHLRGRVCAEFAGRAPGETCTGRGRGEERRGE